MKLVITIESKQSSVSMAELQEALKNLGLELGLVAFPAVAQYLVSEVDLREIKENCTSVEECIKYIEKEGARNR
jgi:hypothetical protein